ncbi:MAG: hypothetical protein PHQ12_08840 [Chthoniobacteraceae bacterium]|nr:hypothetical protein [Chthoniobacteraceae bacterium]
MAINRKLQLFASRSRFGYRLCALWSACLLLAAPLCAPASINIPPLPKEKKEKKETPLPPHPVPVTVQVLNGGTVQITLRLYGKQEQTTRFLIRKEPALGKIISLQPAGEEVWVLTYQHTTPLQPGELRAKDRILFAAQNTNGTSSPAEILLDIVDAPPRLDGPAPVEFGEIPAGLPATCALTIANAGGGILEGTVSVEAPWTVTPAIYSLGRGERLVLQVGLIPGETVEYKGRLRFSTNQEAQAPLHAHANAPFTAKPAALELEGTAARSGTLSLSNRTAADLRVRITASKRLRLPEQIHLAPRATVSLEAALPPDDPARIDETIRFSLGAITQTVTVHAPAAAPSPTATPLPPPPAATPAATPVASAPPVAPPPSTERSPSAPPSGALPGLPAPEPFSPPDGKLLPFLQGVTVVRTTRQGAVEFAWNAPAAADLPAAGSLRYQVEIRRISLDTAGNMEQRWIPVPGVRFTENAGRVNAAFEGVPEGVQDTARAVALAPDGQRCAQSLPFGFAIPSRPRLYTPRRALLAVFTLVLAAALAARWAQKKRGR